MGLHIRGGLGTGHLLCTLSIAIGTETVFKGHAVPSDGAPGLIFGWCCPRDMKVHIAKHTACSQGMYFLQVLRVIMHVVWKFVVCEFGTVAAVFCGFIYLFSCL